MRNFDNLLISEDMSVEMAMKVIDAGGCKTAFLIKDGKLQGTLTDGDIRRFLLKNGDVHLNVKGAINYEPRFFYDTDNVDHQAYMIKNVLTALPIVDREKRIVRIEMLNQRQQVKKITQLMSVIMMAGGKGTRLKPYTDIIPKPLIPIGEKTITEHILDRFVSYGCEKIYMIVNYKKSLIEAYFKDIDSYTQLCFIEEPFFMGTVGGISLLKDKIEENFFLVNCDILINADYYEIWNEHMKKNNIISIICAKKKIAVPYGTIETTAEGKIVSLKEKPNLTYNINTGMYVCSKRIYSYINDNEYMDMPNLIQKCIDAGERVGQILIDEDDWYDMGQPEELELMKRRLGII